MAEGTITNPDITGVEVEETVEKRDIRKNLLIARKAQLQRKKRGYGKLPKTLRRQEQICQQEKALTGRPEVVLRKRKERTAENFCRPGPTGEVSDAGCSNCSGGLGERGRAQESKNKN